MPIFPALSVCRLPQLCFISCPCQPAGGSRWLALVCVLAFQCECPSGKSRQLHTPFVFRFTHRRKLLSLLIPKDFLNISNITPDIYCSFLGLYYDYSLTVVLSHSESLVLFSYFSSFLQGVWSGSVYRVVCASGFPHCSSGAGNLVDYFRVVMKAERIHFCVALLKSA